MKAGWESLFAGSLTLLPESANPTKTDLDALAELPARRGVLLFVDTENQPIQLVQTANLRTLSRSRLAAGTDDSSHRKADLSAVTCRLYYTCCENDFERHLLYQRLTHAVFGNQWKKWVALPRRSYAVLDRSTPFCSFCVTGSVQSDPSCDLFGPFPNRRAAAFFCESLNIAFELCRNPALLHSGMAQSCPYLQMQSCHGLCCQEHGHTQYTLRVQKALRCAEDGVTEAAADLESQMKHAAAALNFETAQLRKKQGERLSAILGPDFAWTGRLAAMHLLVIVFGGKTRPQNTKKRTACYQLWKIDIDSARLLGTFPDKDPAALQHILANTHIHTSASLPYPYAISRREHLETIGWFLYRRNRPGLWYNAAKTPPNVETILADLSEIPLTNHR